MSELFIISGIILLVAFLLLLFIAYFGFWIWMIVDATTHRWEKRLLWLLLIYLVPFAVIFYYFMVKRKQKRKKAKDLETLPLAGWIIALASSFLGFLGLLALPVSFVLGIIALKKAKKDRPLAIATIVVSAVSFSFLFVIILAYVGGMLFLTTLDLDSETRWNSALGSNPHLVSKGVTVGQDVYDLCEPRSNLTFSSSESICFVPYVSNFTKIGGMHYFDMRLLVEDSEGNVDLYYGDVWKEEGRDYLFDDALDGSYLIIPGSELEPDTYTFTLTVIDKYDWEELPINGSFSIR